MPEKIRTAPCRYTEDRRGYRTPAAAYDLPVRMEEG
jgi:hypothetical protein